MILICFTWPHGPHPLNKWMKHVCGFPYAKTRILIWPLPDNFCLSNDPLSAVMFCIQSFKQHIYARCWNSVLCTSCQSVCRRSTTCATYNWRMLLKTLQTLYNDFYQYVDGPYSLAGQGHFLLCWCLGISVHKHILFIGPRIHKTTCTFTYSF